MHTRLCVYICARVFPLHLYVDRGREIPVKQGAAAKTSDAATFEIPDMLLFVDVIQFVKCVQKCFYTQTQQQPTAAIAIQCNHLNHVTWSSKRHNMFSIFIWIGNVSDCRRIKNDSWSVLKHCDSRESL